jgi:ParB family chromosome partitioning protein
MQKKDKKYRILCGYRRYEALRKLALAEVEAVIYQEDDLTDEQVMRLSLAENTERRDLNDIEIGHFLKSCIEHLGWTQERVGREFGESLGFGLSHSAVNKRLKLHQLWEKRESIDLMFAYLNGEVNFGVISEELIPIDNEKDRDSLYESIVKPFRPTKAELHEIKNLLKENGKGYQSILSKKEIKKLLSQAQSSDNQGCQKLIKLLKIHNGDALTKQQIDFDKKADAIRKSLFGKNASGDDFSIIPPPDMEKDEFTVQFRLARDGLKDNIKKIKQFMNKKEFMDELFAIIDGNPEDV